MGDGQEDLFAALVAHNTAESERITSYVVEIESQAVAQQNPIPILDAPARRFKIISTTKLSRKGPSIAVETHMRTESEDGKVFEDVQKAVLNDKYMAFSPSPRRIEQHFHASYAELSEREKELAGMVFRPDPVELGYGSGGSTLEATLENAKKFKSGGIRWEVQEQTDNEGAGYLAQHFVPTAFEGKKPDAELLIEPDRGFMVTRIRGYDWNDGRTEMSRDVVPQQLDEGIWFPKVVSETWGVAPDTSSIITIKSAKVNCAIPDETFQLPALGLNKEGVLLHRVSADGTQATYVYCQGEWIPKEQQPRETAK